MRAVKFTYLALLEIDYVNVLQVITILIKIGKIDDSPKNTDFKIPYETSLENTFAFFGREEGESLTIRLI